MIRELPTTDRAACTLWRGDCLIGELRVRERSPEMLSGVLTLADAIVDFAGVMQTQLSDPPYDRVLQYPIEPLLVAPTESSPSDHPTSSRVPLKRVSEAETQSVAADLQLGIRDETGELLPARMIVVTEIRFPSELAAKFLDRESELATGQDHAWMVSAAFDRRDAVDARGASPEVSTKHLCRDAAPSPVELARWLHGCV